MTGAAVLTPQQVTFYETFGFLKLSGLFHDDIASITEAFEAVFADDAVPKIGIDVDLHRHEPRLMVPQFIDHHRDLARLRSDPRIVGIVTDLLGQDWEYAESDGNLYWCDSEWHCDVYGSPMEVRHVKLSFYLDALRADTGAVRVLPGTNHYESTYARTLRKRFMDFGAALATYGVDGSQIPATVLDSDPGDLILWDFRTIHAVYNGMDRRRLFTLNFRQVSPTE